MSRNDSVMDRILTSRRVGFEPHENAAMDVQENNIKRASLMCTDCNPCDDQNGFVVCHGGQLSVVPFPTGQGGPWNVCIDIDPATSLPRILFPVNNPGVGQAKPE